MTEKPQRIQLKRAKGWRLQETSKALNGLDAVRVTRPGKWGNPWTVEELGVLEAVERFRRAVFGFWSNGSFCAPHAHPESTIGRIIASAPDELRGKNLACFCPLDQPCHADVLLELANGPKAMTVKERNDADII